MHTRSSVRTVLVTKFNSLFIYMANVHRSAGFDE